MNADEKCQYGIVPNECPHAKGIYTDVLEWGDYAKAVFHREWRPVCCTMPSICPIAIVRGGARGE